MVLLSYSISVVFLCSCLTLTEEVIKVYKCNFEFLNLFQFFLIFTSHILRSCCLVHILLKLLYLFGGLSFWSLYNLPLCLVIFFAVKCTSFSDINIVSSAFLWIILHDWSFPILNILGLKSALFFKIYWLLEREGGINIYVRMNIIFFGCLLHTLYCWKPRHVQWWESTSNRWMQWQCPINWAASASAQVSLFNALIKTAFRSSGGLFSIIHTFIGVVVLISINGSNRIRK